MFVNYREPELDELIQNADKNQEWSELCFHLGMEGQLSTIKRSSDDETSTGNPIPYMAINKRWLKIFKTLCPDKIEYKKYKFSTVPLDGLKEILLCVHQKYFDVVEIWWDNVVKDPLIIGIINGKYSSDKQHYLIGRFGDEILPLEMLEQKAIQRIVSHLKNTVEKVSKTIDECVMDYLDKDQDVNIQISSGHASLYW